MINSSWKPTSAGAISIIAGVTRFYFAWKEKNVNEEAVMTSATAIVTGIGLMFARDNNVTSEQAGAIKPAAQPEVKQ